MSGSVLRLALGALRDSLRGRRRAVASVVFWSVIQMVPLYLSGRLIAVAVDHGFLAGHTGTGIAWLSALAVSMLVGGAAAQQTYVRLGVLVEPFRDALVERTVRAALASGDADSSAAGRLALHVEIVREAYGSGLIAVQGFVVTVISVTLGLVALAPGALILVLPPVIAGLAIFVFTLPSLAARQYESIRADERAADSVSRLALGLRDIVGCGAEEPAAEAVAVDLDAQASTAVAVGRMAAARTAAIAVGGWLPVLLLLGAAPWLLRHGTTTGGLLGALAYVSQSLHGALQGLVRGLGVTAPWLLVALGRIVEATTLPSGRDAATADAAMPDGPLALSHVSFSYGAEAAPVVQDLTLELARDDHLVVVGPSGVGKSTLANLMAGLLEPQEGEVTLGGVPIAGLAPEAAARCRVLVPQEAYVFAGSVWDNLTYLADAVAPATVRAAVDALGAGELIERLGGYTAQIAPGELSAGERQLITLVRAYLSPAPIVLLDEATGHLDAASEARAERAFASRPGALVVIAHRISSAMRARRVLLMDGGRALVGKHEELLATSPLYGELVGRWEAAPAPAGANGNGNGNGHGSRGGRSLLAGLVRRFSTSSTARTSGRSRRA